MSPPPWTLPPNLTETSITASAGFVYLIENTITGRAYVGKKSTTARRGKVTKESSWRTYWGSSAALKADILEHGVENFRRSILSIHATKSELDFAEVREQFRRDVLTANLSDGSRAFHNENIAGRWFRRSLEKRGPRTRR